MQQNTDPYLIKKALEGDSKAFGQLVQKYQAFVFTIVIRIVKVREEAEEVAQDTFIKAYESLSSFRGDSKFSSWLYSIAYRKALDALRKNKKINNLELIEEITEDDTSTIENALTYIEEKERKEVIQKCIKELPEQEAGMFDTTSLSTGGTGSLERCDEETNETMNRQYVKEMKQNIKAAEGW